MTNQDVSSFSVDELQVKVAFLEDALSKLSDEFYAQQKDLQQLSQTVGALIAKLSSSQNSEPQSDVVVDERPPHY